MSIRIWLKADGIFLQCHGEEPIESRPQRLADIIAKVRTGKELDVRDEGSGEVVRKATDEEKKEILAEALLELKVAVETNRQIGAK